MSDAQRLMWVLAIVDFVHTMEEETICVEGHVNKPNPKVGEYEPHNTFSPTCLSRRYHLSMKFTTSTQFRDSLTSSTRTVVPFLRNHRFPMAEVQEVFFSKARAARVINPPANQHAVPERPFRGRIQLLSSNFSEVPKEEKPVKGYVGRGRKARNTSGSADIPMTRTRKTQTHS